VCQEPFSSFSCSKSSCLFTDQRDALKLFTVIVERCPDTNLYVGHVPGFPGAHSQGKTPDELRQNMTEVIAMLLEDGEPGLESESA
jgi:predicted RNase H-like HicB family nuclease